MAVCLSSATVGLVVYLACESLLRQQIEQRFRAIAVERERQINLYLAAEAAMVSQISSRTQLRDVLSQIGEALKAGNKAAAEDVDTASRILADSAAATSNIVEIHIVDSHWQVLASSNSGRIGKLFVDRDGLPDIVYGLVLTPPVETGPLTSQSLLATTIEMQGEHLGTLVCVIDSSDLVNSLEDSDALGVGSRTFLADFSQESDWQELFGSDDSPPPKSGFDIAGSSGSQQFIFWTPVQFFLDAPREMTFVATLPTKQAFAPLLHLRHAIVMTVVVVTLLNSSLAYLSARRTEARLRTLVAEMAGVANGESIDVGSSHEFAYVASAFNDMSREVTSRMAALREDTEKDMHAYTRLTDEIRIAEQIQRCLYPSAPLLTDHLEVVGRSVAAEKLCGDYFDYFRASEDVFFAVGDVSGHGLGPALLMVEIRGAVRGLGGDQITLDEIAERLNRLLQSGAQTGRFVTLFIGRFRPSTGDLHYVGAGHRAHIIRADGRREELKSTGIVLGIVPDAKFVCNQTVFEPGDLLVAASDGIEETTDHQSNLFGIDRLLHCVTEKSKEPIPLIIEDLFRRTKQFRGPRQPADDCTIVLIRNRAGLAIETA